MSDKILPQVNTSTPMPPVKQPRAPSPPTPPPFWLQCSSCGYTAPEPEYKHTCCGGILITLILAIGPLVIIGWIILRL